MLTNVENEKKINWGDDMIDAMHNERLDSSKLCEFCTKNCIKFWTTLSLFVTTNDELMGNWWITGEEMIKKWRRSD